MKQHTAVAILADTAQGNSNVDVLNAKLAEGWLEKEMCANGLGGIVVILEKGGEDAGG